MLGVDENLAPGKQIKASKKRKSVSFNTVTYYEYADEAAAAGRARGRLLQIQREAPPPPPPPPPPIAEEQGPISPPPPSESDASAAFFSPTESIQSSVMMSPGVAAPRLSTLLRQDQAGDEHVPVLSDLLQRDQEEQEAAGAATPDWLRNAGAVLAGGEEDPAEVTMDQTTFVGGGMIPEERPADGDDTEMEFTRNHSGVLPPEPAAAPRSRRSSVGSAAGRRVSLSAMSGAGDDFLQQMTAPPAAGAQQPAPPRARAPRPAPPAHARLRPRSRPAPPSPSSFRHVAAVLGVRLRDVCPQADERRDGRRR